MMENGLEKVVEKLVRHFIKEIRPIFEEEIRLTVKDVNEKLQSTTKTVGILKNANFELKQTIEGFEKEHKVLKETLAQKNDDVDSKSKAMAELDSKLKQYEKQMIALEKQTREMKTEHHATELENIDDDITCLDDENSPRIASGNKDRSSYNDEDDDDDVILTDIFSKKSGKKLCNEKSNSARETEGQKNRWKAHRKYWNRSVLPP